MDEYRKEKRRREEASDDEEDDIKIPSAMGSPFKRNLNASPNSSTYKADSVAGRSRVSSVNNNRGPVNIVAGGRGGNPSATPDALEFSEDVGGVEEYQSKLKELWDKRTSLMRSRRAKKKKGKKKKGPSSALRRPGSEYDNTTVWEDDKTSFMTMAEIG